MYKSKVMVICMNVIDFSQKFSIIKSANDTFFNTYVALVETISQEGLYPSFCI